MPASVFGKALDDRARSAVWWILGCVAVTFIVSSLYPTIRDSESLRTFLADLPPEMLALFGADPDLIFTGAGYLQAQMYSIIAPTAVLAFCVTTAAGVTAREERDGTMDLLASLPISRTSIFAQKTAALAVLSLLIVAALTASLVIWNGVFGLRLSVSGVLSANLGLWWLGLLFGGLTLLVGALTGNPALASGASFVAAVVAWLVTSFAAVYHWLELPSSVSPVTWYNGHQPLLGHWSRSLAWLVLTAAALAVAAAGAFRRRDLGTQLTVMPERADKRRASKKISARSTWLLGNVFAKTLWDYRRTLWLWAGGLCAILAGTVAAWPAMSNKIDAVRSLLVSLPRELLAVLGMTDPELLATPAGFVSSRAYLTIGPVVMIFFCVGAVSKLLAREERAQVLDLVLSSGQRRGRVVGAKLGAIAALAGLIALAMTVVLLIADAAWDTQLPVVHIVGANVGLALLGLFFAGVAVAMWGAFGARGPAIRVTVAVVVVSHLMNAFGAIVAALAPLRLASPFYWYVGDSAPLARGLPASYLLLLAGAVGGAAVAARRFAARDVGL